MEHIEEAGIHSGDSACALLPIPSLKKLSPKLKRQTRELARPSRPRADERPIRIKNNEIYLIEVTPAPPAPFRFVGKATGVPWAKIAAKVMAGQSLAGAGRERIARSQARLSERSCLPLHQFPGVDVILGPEMRSTAK